VFRGVLWLKHQQGEREVVVVGWRDSSDAMYWYLNVLYPTSDPDAVSELLLRACELGYDGLCWNFVVGRKLTAADVCPRLASAATGESKSSSSSSSRSSSSGGGGGSKGGGKLPSGSLLRLDGHLRGNSIAQKTRLTLTVASQADAFALSSNSEVVKSYDVVALYPTSAKVLHHVVSQSDFDILRLDCGAKWPFSLKAPVIRMCIERGIFIEISYAAAIHDPTARRFLIQNISALLRLTRGKNLFLSSEAKHTLSLRGPHDVKNLGVVFGLPVATAEKAMSVHARSILLHGETRRTLKALIRVSNGDDSGGLEQQEEDSKVMDESV
jgi:RNase P/RNase MRP subunit p30